AAGTDQSTGALVPGYMFVLPVGIIRTVLADHGIHPADGPVTTKYDAALADYYRGYYKRALPEFRAVLAAYPQHPYAARYLRQSEQQMAEGHDGTPSSPWPPLLIALGVLGAAAAGGGGAIVAARRRRAASRTPDGGTAGAQAAADGPGPGQSWPIPGTSHSG